MFFTVSPGGRITFSSPAVKKVLGRDPEGLALCQIFSDRDAYKIASVKGSGILRINLGHAVFRAEVTCEKGEKTVDLEKISICRRLFSDDEATKHFLMLEARAIDKGRDACLYLFENLTERFLWEKGRLPFFPQKGDLADFLRSLKSEADIKITAFLPEKAPAVFDPVLLKRAVFSFLGKSLTWSLAESEKYFILKIKGGKRDRIAGPETAGIIFLHGGRLLESGKTAVLTIKKGIAAGDAPPERRRADTGVLLSFSD